jgi:hypothetical protein
MRAPRVAVVLTFALLAFACGGVLKPEYEYEEELYLNLDGSATLYVNASVPALVALRGADLDVNPRARFDRARIRALFEGPNVQVSTPTSSRRNGRRFVHVRVDGRSLADLEKLAPFSWSSYDLAAPGELLEYRQVVGASAGRQVGDVGWTGAEIVAFRVHLPSRISYNNAKSGVQRGNILEWQQPLTARLAGAPLDMQAHIETRSILRHTLLLFASTIVAAAAAFALALWWIARKGRASEMVESRP